MRALVMSLVYLHRLGDLGASVTLLAKETNVKPAELRKALRKMHQDGLVEMVPTAPAPRAPAYVEFTWLYKITEEGSDLLRDLSKELKGV